MSESNPLIPSKLAILLLLSVAIFLYYRAVRDFRIQALIDLWKTIYKREIGVFELLNYLSYWLLPGKVKTLKANKFFDLKDFYLLKKIIFNLGKKDPAWFPRLIEPSTLGIRGWEYGHLFL